MEGFVRASGGFMQQQLERRPTAEQADQKAGDKISVVKARGPEHAPRSRRAGRRRTPQISGERARRRSGGVWLSADDAAAHVAGGGG